MLIGCGLELNERIEGIGVCHAHRRTADLFRLTQCDKIWILSDGGGNTVLQGKTRCLVFSVRGRKIVDVDRFRGDSTNAVLSKQTL